VAPIHGDILVTSVVLLGFQLFGRIGAYETRNEYMAVEAAANMCRLAIRLDRLYAANANLVFEIVCDEHLHYRPH
jgi:hypothetical protein